MEKFVCLYSIDYFDDFDNKMKTDYGLVYANSFADAVEKLEKHIYGYDFIKINSMELFESHAALSEETFRLIRKDLETL